MQTKNDILNLILSQKDSIKGYGAKSLGLFGSFVRNTPTESSDVDLVVEFQPGKKMFDNFIELAYLLEELLGRKVELVTLNGLSPYIKPYILKEIEYVSFTPSPLKGEAIC